MIRPATLQDINEIMPLLLWQASRYPARPDKAKMLGCLKRYIPSPTAFIYVAEKDGAIGGALIARVTENAWMQKKTCIVDYWASKIPGEGANMLRELLRWVKQRRSIRITGIVPDLDCDERIWKLAERVGFSKSGGIYIYVN